jgi:hypothetical protein
VRLGFVLPQQAEEFTMPVQEHFRLDKEQSLLPRTDSPGEKYQEQSICLSADGSFDVSTQDDQLLAQERIFRQEFGFASDQINECCERKGGRGWFEPTQNPFVERMHASSRPVV